MDKNTVFVFTTTLKLILTLLFLQSVDGDYIVKFRCTDQSELPRESEDLQQSSLEPVQSVEGRYQVQYCFENKKKYTYWDVSLNYYKGIGKSKCNRDYLNSRLRTRRTHSSYEYNITHINCSRTTDINENFICVTGYLDLVHTGCFLLQNMLSAKQSARYQDSEPTITQPNQPNEDIIYITNNVTGPEYYNKESDSDTKTLESAVKNNTIPVLWLSNKIPFQEGMYIVQWCMNHSATPCEVVTDSCHLSNARLLRCDIPVNLTAGHTDPGLYGELWLEHRAPWTSSELFRDYKTWTRHFYAELPSTAESTSLSTTAILYMVGGVILIVGLIVPGLYLYCYGEARLKQMWWRTFHSFRKINSQVKNIDEMERGNHLKILVLYCKDEPAIELAWITACMKMLTKIGNVEIIDFHSPKYTNKIMRNQTRQLQDWLKDSDVIVVVMMTCRMKAFVSEERETGMTRSSAALLSFLQTMQQGGHETPFKKYYPVTLSTVETVIDIMQVVVPNRFYSFPENAQELYRHIAFQHGYSDSDIDSLMSLSKPEIDALETAARNCIQYYLDRREIEQC